MISKTISYPWYALVLALSAVEALRGCEYCVALLVAALLLPALSYIATQLYSLYQSHA